jgi:hypothetical protein
MAELSPAAQAVLDAVLYRMCAGESEDYARGIAAAALRPAADQVVPDIDQSLLGGWKYATTVAQQKLQIKIRSDFLAIAAELEQAADTNTTEAQ